MSIIIKLPRVSDDTGLSRSSIYSFIKKGTFPKPIKLGERAVDWKSDDILQWIENRYKMNGVNHASK